MKVYKIQGGYYVYKPDSWEMSFYTDNGYLYYDSNHLGNDYYIEMGTPMYTLPKALITLLKLRGCI